ncbi:MAG TPA: Clp protease N-terminal domain-containing protein [Phycisphaerae bacterium]|nr:Clp protease N-terminal domain-containing protein [Phycisphaerae bacterium]
MHERFSDRARHAMALANLEAGRLNHSYLAPAHLMLGLIGEGECVATETLRLLEVDLDAVRDEVQAQMEAGDTEGRVGRRAQSKELKEVISLAIAEARKFNHRYVGTEHLIVALLAHGDSIPSRVLGKQGLDPDTLREKALATLRSNADAGQDLSHSRHGDFEWVHQQELAKAFRSPTFWHTMILAVDSANRLGAGEVEPLHLLLALLRDPSSGVAELLGEKGVTADWVRERIAREQGAGRENGE